MFTTAEIDNCRKLITIALGEDLGTSGDITTQAILPADQVGSAVFVARMTGVVAGLPAVGMVLAAVDSKLVFAPLLADGGAVQSGTPLARVLGPVRSILAGERTALNFLQRLSGVASLTRQYVDRIAGLPCRILDTRKTTPGWRFLEKYAVRCGGGQNHRFGLFDGILVKDNHVAALGGHEDAIRRAVRLVREQVGHSVPVEVEVDTLEQLDVALASGSDIILLDNMTVDQLREAVRRRNSLAPGVELEASGGVTLASVRAIAETGVERVSVGALTHSAPALDIALDYELLKGGTRP